MQRAEQNITLPLSRIEAVIREGDGYTERALLKKHKKIYQVIPFYVAASTVKLGEKTDVTSKDILDLLTPDQEYMLVEIYKLNYGDVFEFPFSCPHCEKESDIEWNLDKLVWRDLKGVAGPDPIIQLSLPRTGMTAEIGCLTGHKEALLMELAQTSLDLNQGDYQCLRSLDGKREFSYEDVVHLPLADHRAIRRARKKLLCGYDTEINITCPACEEKISVNILMQPDFLFSG